MQQINANNFIHKVNTKCVLFEGDYPYSRIYKIGLKQQN